MVKKKPQHLSMIQAEFSRRKEKNPRYSLRAFSQSLGISTPTLSRILSGTQDISTTACRKIIRKLKFNESQTLIFISSVAEERCDRTYKILSTNFNSHDLRPHERNVFFISNLDLKCLFINSAPGKLVGVSENEPINKIMRRLGFQERVASNIDDSIRETAVSGKTKKYHFPITTEAGDLIIDCVFTPLIGKTGRIESVVSILQSVHLDVLMKEYVSKG